MMCSLAKFVLFSLCAAFILSGCMHARQPSGPQLPPGSFVWMTSTIEATGTARSDDASAATRLIVGQQAAKTAALADLKRQVSALPVTPQENLGQIMMRSISVKRAVEKHLQSAKVVSGEQTAPGSFTVRVRLPLAPIADILRQHNITPEGMPPLPEEEPSTLPPTS